MRQKIEILLILVTGSVAVIFFMALANRLIHNNHYGFYRLFPPHSVEELRTVDIKSSSCYIAGITNTHVFLADAKNPFKIIAVDTGGTTATLNWTVDHPEAIAGRPLKVVVRDSSFYVSSGAVPLLLKGELRSGKAVHYIGDSIFFSAAVPVGSRSVVVRTMSNHYQREVLAKLTGDFPHVRVAPDLLQKQIDGLFCTDGTLLDDLHGHLIYVYYYRNQFLYMDTSLNLMYRGRTIDTISHAQIKVAKIESEGVMTLAEPPLHVNKQSCVDGQWLFVNSGLLSQNEDKARFDQASAIDVYNLITGDYQFSFYLYDEKDKKFQDFRIKDNIVYALFDHSLLTYRLNTKLFRSR